MKLDISTAGLLISNLLVIILTILLGWNPFSVIWIYYAETILLGIITMAGFVIRGFFTGRDGLLFSFLLCIVFLFPFAFITFSFFPFLAFLVRMDAAEFLDVYIGAGILFAGLLVTLFFDVIKPGEGMSSKSIVSIPVEFLLPFFRLITIYLSIFGLMFSGVVAIAVAIALGSGDNLLQIFQGTVIVMFMSFKTVTDLAAHLLRRIILGLKEANLGLDG